MALSEYVKAPEELQRRLAQIGVVERADGPARRHAGAGPTAGVARRRFLALGRFCGRRACADRRRRRLAERGRLQAIESELASARSDVEGKRGIVDAAEAALERGDGCGNRSARPLARGPAPHRCRARATVRRRARDQPQRGRAFRRSRKPASASAAARDETQLARAEAENALAALPDAGEIESKLADINATIARERSACAEQRGEAQRLRANPSLPITGCAPSPPSAGMERPQ